MCGTSTCQFKAQGHKEPGEEEGEIMVPQADSISQNAYSYQKCGFVWEVVSGHMQ